jgi:hypothetical protein
MDKVRTKDATLQTLTIVRLQINSAGRMSDDRRNEGQLLCDVIGLESSSTK